MQAPSKMSYGQMQIPVKYQCPCCVTHSGVPEVVVGAPFTGA